VVGEGEALREVIAGKMRDFGTAAHSGDYKPMSLDDMKKVYASR